MKKADMVKFRNYLHYYMGLSEERMQRLTEEEFKTLKDYYFREQEGYDLQGDYNEYKETVEKFFAVETA